MANTVHPHLRGDYVYCPMKLSSSAGSSPLAWGLHRAARELSHLRTVHPHLRGDYTNILV